MCLKRAHWRNRKANLREVRHSSPDSAMVHRKFGGFLKQTLADHLSSWRTVKIRRTPSNFGGHFKSTRVWRSSPHRKILADCDGPWQTVAESARKKFAVLLGVPNVGKHKKIYDMVILDLKSLTYWGDRGPSSWSSLRLQDPPEKGPAPR